MSRTEHAFTSPIWCGEVELQTFLFGRTGNWRIGGTLGNVAEEGSVRGLHVSADHWISSNKGVFGRFAVGNAGPGSLSLGPVRQSYSGGFQWRFVDEQERVSAWGIGFSQAFPISSPGPRPSERLLETYYRWQLTRQFSFTPDFQLVLGSGGSRTQGTHVVLGAHMNLAF